MKHFLLISLLLIYSIFSFSQESKKQEKRSYKWEQIVSYNNDSTIKTIEKEKRLRVVDLTSKNTQCFLIIIKEYKSKKCIKKEYITTTTGGCIVRLEYKHKYKKRFPHFFFFRTKVLLGSLGWKSLLYK